MAQEVRFSEREKRVLLEAVQYRRSRLFSGISNAGLEISPTSDLGKTLKRTVEFYDQLLEKLEQLPVVEEAETLKAT